MSDFPARAVIDLALQAGVPLGLGFVDYRLKQVGIGAWIDLSGDAKVDFDRIRDFYAGKHGRVPGNAGAICLRDEAASALAPVRSVDKQVNRPGIRG